MHFSLSISTNIKIKAKMFEAHVILILETALRYVSNFFTLYSKFKHFHHIRLSKRHHSIGQP